MPTEVFDDILTAAYENGLFIPKYNEEMSIVRESQLRITERKELAVSPAQCQGECNCYGIIVFHTKIYEQQTSSVS